MDLLEMTAPCGLDCFNCAVFHAANNERIRKAVAERLQVPEESAVCRGCRPQEGVIGAAGMKGPCKAYRCVMEKGYAFCFECPEFPCDHLHPFADHAADRPHNTKVFNLCLIQRMGLEAWAAQKAKKVRETYFRGRLVLANDPEKND